MLFVNGQQFSPEKVLFLPRPNRVLRYFFLLVILGGFSPVSRWILGGFSKIVIYFYQYSHPIPVWFPPDSHPIPKKRLFSHCSLMNWSRKIRDVWLKSTWPPDAFRTPLRHFEYETVNNIIQKPNGSQTLSERFLGVACTEDCRYLNSGKHSEVGPPHEKTKKKSAQNLHFASTSFCFESTLGRAPNPKN